MVVSGGPASLGGGCLGTFTSLLLLAWTATLNAARIPVPPACGKPQQLNRVVGGEDSTDNEWPWVVSIQKNGTHHCAGSLLTSRWVITAAHCFKDNLNKPSLFSVLLGAWQLGNPGSRSQKVGVAWVQPHPMYSWKEGARADIALVRLEHSIQFSERVLPICLPDASIHLPPNTHCWISGWGSIQDGVPLPHPQTLQKLKVPIIDSEVCSRLYWRGAGHEAITEDMLCAGYLEGERDACLGRAADGEGPESRGLGDPALPLQEGEERDWEHPNCALDSKTGWLLGPHPQEPIRRATHCEALNSPLWKKQRTVAGQASGSVGIRN
ncbi:brain-specific serine protease 4 isoform X1 [Papio anubis]|uniref:brain-specific serine protease 4 isoform X1 n=1 Tax=Papio anubis TaxID=9555 RepID=UPI0004F224BD|nr:brain-specific serine protease 4 isoform X1 [Papio anubis]XP_009194035.1 brain-specific serine protease 4 isoform X1 [Papio anubis]